MSLSKKCSLSDFLSNQYLFTNMFCFLHKIIQHFSHVKSWLVGWSTICQLELLQFLVCQLLSGWTNCSLPLVLLFSFFLSPSSSSFFFLIECTPFALIMRREDIASNILHVHVLTAHLTITINFFWNCYPDELFLRQRPAKYLICIFLKDKFQLS